MTTTVAPEPAGGAPGAGAPGAAEHAVVDAENPWPGLESFREGDAAFFRGRARDAEALLQLVRRERVAVLFGVSGLGKTSLMRAGLFPPLRAERVLPVYLRLVHDDAAAPLRDQVLDAVAAAARAAGLEVPASVPDDTLWEHFHRTDADYWTADNQLATPLLVLDQFEEVFTLGAEPGRVDRTAAFLEELGDLIEGRSPRALRERLERREAQARDFDFVRHRYKLLLALRADFLGDLEALRARVPSLGASRYRLLPLSGRAALEVTAVGGPALVAPDVGERIVRLVAGESDDAAGSVPLEQLTVDPPLLSLFCRELNERRKRRPDAAAITADLLSGSRDAILTDFYERSVAGLDPRVRAFVEDRLLTSGGFRNTVAQDDALAVDGVTRAALDALVARRLVRREDRDGRPWLELTHDVLTGVVRRSKAMRDESQRFEQSAREAREQAAALTREAGVREAALRAARRTARRARAVAGLVVVLLLGALAAGAAAFRERAVAVAAGAVALRERGGALASERRARASEQNALAAERSALASADTARIARQRAVDAAEVATRNEARANAALAAANVAEQRTQLEAVRVRYNDLAADNTVSDAAGRGATMTGSPYLNYVRATTLESAGQHEAAIDAFSRALRGDSAYWSARVNRCDAYLNAGKPDSAVRDCERARKVDPRSTVVQLNLGVAYAMLGRFDASVAAFDRAIEGTHYQYVEGTSQLVSAPAVERLAGRRTVGVRHHDVLATLQYGRASTLAYEGQDAQVRDFLAALATADRQARSADAMWNALNWTYLQRRYADTSADGTLRDYGVFVAEGALWERLGPVVKGAKAQADSSYARFLHAYERRREPRYAALARAVRAGATAPAFALRLTPAPSEAEVRRDEVAALEFLNAGHPDSAVERLGSAIRLAPDDIGLRLTRVGAYLRQLPDSTTPDGERDRWYRHVMPDIDRVLAVEPRLADALAYRAWASLGRDCWDCGRRDLPHRELAGHDADGALAASPLNTWALWAKYILERDRAPRAALTYMRRLSEADPENDGHYFDLAQAYLATAAYPDARRAVDSAVLLNPGALWYYNLRARVDSASGRPPAEYDGARVAAFETAGARAARSNDWLAATDAYYTAATFRHLRLGMPPSAVRDTMHRQLQSLGVDVAHYGTARYLAWAGDTVAARAAIDSAIAAASAGNRTGRRLRYEQYRRSLAAGAGALQRWAASDSAGDQQLRTGDVSLALNNYFTGLHALLTARTTGGTVSPGAVDRAADKMATAVVRLLGSVDAATTELENADHLANANWPETWTPADRAALRPALRDALARQRAGTANTRSGASP